MDTPKNNERNERGLQEKEIKTAEFPMSYNLEKNIDDANVKKISWYKSSASINLFHHFCLLILILLAWGLLWTAFGDGWRWDGPWFRIVAVGVVAWVSGQVLQAVTTLPPVIAALLVGIFARNLEILDMRDYTHIDSFLRKIYPVLILGKGSLAWDVDFMKKNWQQVAALGILPWSAEVLTMTVCTNQLLGFPWIWGVLLGAVYASVSCPVIMPSVQKIGARAGRNWPQIICTAGGTDTMLSVGVYGLVFTYIFSDADDTYRYIKAALALVVGVVVGVTWGSVAGLAPHSRDYYVTEIRVLLVLLGGLFGNFFTAHIGWGGTGGVAVLACNATAARYWARDGWKLNNNAASTTYRVLWAAAEPLVFAYSGTFFVINSATGRTLLYGLAILAICLTVRLCVAAVVCWDMTVKERLFVMCTWSTKSVVEAVLCPVAINAFLTMDKVGKEMEYAEDVLRLLVEAILITTPLGFALTHYLGPWLLKENEKDVERDVTEIARKMSCRSSPSESINQKF